MSLKILWKELPFPELDYIQLTELLKDYSQPRRKINALLRSGELIRVHKGLYVLGKNHPYYRPPSKFRLANLIYGPSYISLQSALNYYGLIPEAVHSVTSVNLKRNKEFQTPLGRFTYTYRNPSQYSLGISLADTPGGYSILIASPEKAILDLLWEQRTSIEKVPLQPLFEEDLRIEEEELSKLDRRRLCEYLDAYGFSKVMHKKLQEYFEI